MSVGKKWDLDDKLSSSISVEVDVFNVLNHRYATDFDYNFTSGPGIDICEIGVDPGCDSFEDQQRILVEGIPNGPPNPNFGKPTEFNAPREVRVGFKWSF